MKDLILLHGAMGSSDSLLGLKDELTKEFNCHLFNFNGHGKTPFSTEGFGIEYFADELEAFIKEKGLKEPSVFGYSMGGYVALYLASLQPYLIGSIITLGTKFAWSPESADHETSRMNPEIMELKIPAYTKKLEEFHGPQWKDLVWHTAGMMIGLGEEPLLTIDCLKTVQNEVLIMRGSEDQMVGDVESKWAVANLQNGKFKTLESQAHPIEKVDLEVLANSIYNYL